MKSLSKATFHLLCCILLLGTFQSCKDDETTPPASRRKRHAHHFRRQGRSQYRNFHHHAEKCRCLYLYDQIRDGNASSDRSGSGRNQNLHIQQSASVERLYDRGNRFYTRRSGTHFYRIQIPNARHAGSRTRSTFRRGAVHRIRRPADRRQIGLLLQGNRSALVLHLPARRIRQLPGHALWQRRKKRLHIPQLHAEPAK